MPAKRWGIHRAVTVALLIVGIAYGGGAASAQPFPGGRTVPGAAPELFSFGVEGVPGAHHVVLYVDGTVVATGYGRTVVSGRRVPWATRARLRRMADRIHTAKTAGFVRLFWNLRRASGLRFCGEITALASPCRLSDKRSIPARAEVLAGGKTATVAAPVVFAFGVHGMGGSYDATLRADGTVTAVGLGRTVIMPRQVSRFELARLERLAHQIGFGRLPPIIAIPRLHHGVVEELPDLVITFQWKTVTTQPVHTPATAGFDRLFVHLLRASHLRRCGTALFSPPCRLSPGE
jgi:hypothetical protein